MQIKNRLEFFFYGKVKHIVTANFKNSLKYNTIFMKFFKNFFLEKFNKEIIQYILKPKKKKNIFLTN